MGGKTERGMNTDPVVRVLCVLVASVFSVK